MYSNTCSCQHNSTQHTQYEGDDFSFLFADCKSWIWFADFNQQSLWPIYGKPQTGIWMSSRMVDIVNCWEFTLQIPMQISARGNIRVILQRDLHLLQVLIFMKKNTLPLVSHCFFHTWKSFVHVDRNFGSLLDAPNHSSAISWQGLYTTPTYPGVELGLRRPHNLLDHLMPQFDSGLGPDQVMCSEVVKCYLDSPADLLSYELRQAIDLRYLWPSVLNEVPWVPTTSYMILSHLSWLFVWV